MPVLLGSIWKHVWGSSGDEYSKQVIRSYICYHGTIVKQNRRRSRGGQLNINSIAAIHRGGSTDLRTSSRVHSNFISSVREMVQSGKLIYNCILSYTLGLHKVVATSKTQ